MTLANIFKTIKEQTSLHADKPNIIYIGVGTYAGLRESDGSLANKNYHQYPPFLQNLKNKIPDLRLSILLIDPIQENPPYMVADKGLLLCNDNVYSSKDQSLMVYVARERVQAQAKQTEQVQAQQVQAQQVQAQAVQAQTQIDSINIIPLLRDLNNHVINQDIALIYHDFSGKDNRILAEYFDDELKEHLNHVIYGLGLREDFACYFDLTDPCSSHPFGLTCEGKLRFFNIYYYIVNEKMDSMFYTDKDTENSIIIDRYINYNDNKDTIDKHFINMLLIIKKQITNTTLQVLRVVFRLVMGEDIKDFDSGVIEFGFLQGAMREKCVELAREGKYCDLYNLLLNYYGKKLDIVSAVKGLDITGREMLEFITLGDDPFKWYNNVREFF
jgi:hypothetical protein